MSFPSCSLKSGRTARHCMACGYALSGDKPAWRYWWIRPLRPITATFVVTMPATLWIPCRFHISQLQIRFLFHSVSSWLMICITNWRGQKVFGTALRNEPQCGSSVIRSDCGLRRDDAVDLWSFRLQCQPCSDDACRRLCHDGRRHVDPSMASDRGASFSLLLALFSNFLVFGFGFVVLLEIGQTNLTAELA